MKKKIDWYDSKLEKHLLSLQNQGTHLIVIYGSCVVLNSLQTST